MNMEYTATAMQKTSYFLCLRGKQHCKIGVNLRDDFILDLKITIEKDFFYNQIFNQSEV